MATVSTPITATPLIAVSNALTTDHQALVLTHEGQDPIRRRQGRRATTPKVQHQGGITRRLAAELGGLETGAFEKAVNRRGMLTP